MRKTSGELFDKIAVPLEKARQGDIQAQKQIIELTQDQLFRFCYYLSHSREQAEELAQETYLRALQSLAQIEKPSAFLDWLFKIAKNRFLDQVRSKGYETSQNEMPGDDALTVSEPDRVLSLHVRQVLSQFEAEDRALLILVDMEEYSYAEAGKIIGISEAAVKSRVFRLRQEFVKVWEKLETK